MNSHTKSARLTLCLTFLILIIAFIYVIFNYINYVIIYIKILKEKGKLLYMAEEIGKSLISLKKAGKIYGSVTALRKIDLDIYKGQSVTIFGSNGAGKSTLLKILSMQTRLSSGSLLFNGVESKKLADVYRANFGVISHQPFVYENLSAMENLEFYGSLYNVKNVKERAESLLKQLDLYARRNDAVRTYSRGMLQRISIARALIHSPEIIFLDEPYTGLDSLAGNRLSNLLKEQLSSNKTIIMVTHDIHTGLDLASQVIIMKSGNIIFNKPKSEIDESSFEKLYLELTDV